MSIPYSCQPSPGRRTARWLLSAIKSGLLLVLCGCGALEYEPNKKRYVEVPEPDLRMAVDFGASGDTLIGWGVIEVDYDFDLSGKEFAYTVVYLDGGQINQTDNPSRFELDSRALSDGAHTLELEVYARSSNGSLADRLGAELVHLRRGKILVVDNGPPSTVSVTSVRPFDGRLRIDWQSYGHLNFLEYQIFRERGQYYNEGRLGWMGGILAARISDRAATSWLDSSYVGGPVRYWIVIHGSNGQAVGDPVMFEASGPHFLHYEAAGDRKIKLIWSATDFPENHSAYVLRRYVGQDAVELARIADASDTTFVDTIDLFGEIAYYSLETISQPDSPWYEGGGIAAWIGNRMPDIRSVPVPLGDALLTYTDSAFVLLDLNNLSILAEHKPGPQYHDGFAVDEEGTRFFTFAQQSATEHDPNTLMPIRTWDLAQEVGYPFVSSSHGITKNGYLWFYTWHYPPPGPTQYAWGPIVFHLDSFRVITRLNDENPYAYILDISSDGRYAVMFPGAGNQGDEYMFELIGDKYEPVYSLPLPSGCPVGHFLGAESFIESCEGQIIIRKASDRTVVSSISVPSDFQAVKYDAASGYIYGLSPSTSRFLAFDPDTGQMVVDMPVAVNGAVYGLSGHMLWSSFGFYKSIRL